MSYVSAVQLRNEKGFAEGDDIYVWECIDHKHVRKTYKGIFEFYTEDEDGDYNSIYGTKLKKHEFDTFSDFRMARKMLKEERGMKLYESDISPDTKVLSKYYFNKEAPTLNVLMWDIETSNFAESFSDNHIVDIKIKGGESIEATIGDIRSLPRDKQKQIDVWDKKRRKWVNYVHSKFEYDGPTGYGRPENPFAPINAISIYKDWLDESIVLTIPPPGWDIEDLDKSLLDLADIRFFKTEAELLKEFLEEIEDASILSAYNGSGFDDPYTAKRIEMVLGEKYLKKLSFPGANTPRFREVFVKGREQLQVEFSGRVQLDYLELFKKFEVSDRASFKLESVSEDYLPHLKKLSYNGTLEQLYHEDYNHFLRYNIRDTEILKGLEEKLGYIKTANLMIHSSTNQFNHIFGTVRMVDNAIINYCHHDLGNIIVPDRWDTKDGNIQGAYVLLPQKGKHKWMGAIDLNSLYPSDIQAINISPETQIGQFVNNIKDWECIASRKEVELTLTYEDGSVETKLTSEWAEYLWDMKYAVSGYGTVYSQQKVGVIPSLLNSWYKQRKQYQKLKKEHTQNANHIKYESDSNGNLLEGSDGKYIEKSSYDVNLYEKEYEQSKFYDRLQFIFKIKLNSTYGCLSNYNFRFFRLEMGESVTGTGRMILRHQCRKTNEILEGNYDVNFPLYESTAQIDKMLKERHKKRLDSDDDYFFDFVHKDINNVSDMLNASRQEFYHDDTLTHDLALDGPIFKGHFQSECVIAGDTDSVHRDTIVNIDGDEDTIENHFNNLIDDENSHYMKLPNDVEYIFTHGFIESPCISEKEWDYKPVQGIYRHKVKKKMYRVTTSSGRSIVVTGDHSLVIINENNVLESVKTTDAKIGSKVIEMKRN